MVVVLNVIGDVRVGMVLVLREQSKFSRGEDERLSPESLWSCSAACLRYPQEEPECTHQSISMGGSPLWMRKKSGAGVCARDIDQ